MAIKFRFPIWWTESKIAEYMEWEGFCAFIILFFADKKPSKHVIRHEMIHFHQYKELLIFPFIIVYLGFFIINWIIYRSADISYRRNPFEIEAHLNEEKRNYLRKRRFLAWTDYIGQELPEYDDYDDYDD